MVFHRYYRIHSLDSGNVIFRGAGLCAQQVYDDYKRSKGQRVAAGVSGNTQAQISAALGEEDWIDDDSIFMVAEEAGQR